MRRWQGPGLTRRRALQLGAAAAAASGLAPWAWAAGKSGLHGLSVFGDLKYPADFANFAYINPDAPKGGRMNFQPPYRYFNQSFSTFNTLNSFVLKGDAPPRMEMCFDTLMASAEDEPDSLYGLIAESVDVSEDLSTYTFHIRPEARFQDGTLLISDDVAFSLMLIKEKGHPTLAEPLTPMVSVEAAESTVIVKLDDRRTRETILSIAGNVPIFSKEYYSDPAHPFDSSSLDAPLSSGPYRVGNKAAGRYVEYERVPDYWGADLPVNVGFYNFDKIRIDFFAERQAQFEAFKKGETTFREEFTSITWAQDYNFPAVTSGKVKKTTEFPEEKKPSFQGFYFNSRRDALADPRTRLAVGLAFDFEWANANLFFGSYARAASLFGTSDYAATGKPSKAELAILEPFRKDLPEEVFGNAWVPPKTDGSGRDRAILKQASDLLAEAGYKQMNNVLVDGEAAPLTIEVLIDAQVFERILTPWANNLQALGITASVRQVDPAQYAQRVNSFDFDVILANFGLPATPIDDLNQLYKSTTADQPGSNNFAGVKEPAVDAALAKLPAVKTRDDLITITRAIDRVVRARHYVMPSWYLANHRTAYWDIFGHPAEKPDYAFTPESTWWFDREKADAIGYTG